MSEIPQIRFAFLFKATHIVKSIILRKEELNSETIKCHSRLYQRACAAGTCFVELLASGQFKCDQNSMREATFSSYLL